MLRLKLLKKAALQQRIMHLPQLRIRNGWKKMVFEVILHITAEKICSNRWLTVVRLMNWPGRVEGKGPANSAR